MRRYDGAQRDRPRPLRGKRTQNNKDAHIESSLTKSISNFRKSRHILDGGILTFTYDVHNLYTVPQHTELSI